MAKDKPSITKGWLFWLLLPLLFISCNDQVVFEQNAEIPEAIWNVNQKVKLELDIEDTVSQHNFYLNVRNTEEYPYSNLYVFVTTVFPNEKKSIDTVGCILADKNGKWLGTGNGFIFDNQVISNKIMFQYNKRFPLKGKYTMYIEQGMREQELKGIMNIGLRIEKATTSSGIAR